MDFLNTLPNNFALFLTYLAVSIVLLGLFIFIYEKVTPYREIDLIKNGNKAAGISLSGAIIGFTLPIYSCVVHTVNVVEMGIWAIATLVVQLLAFFIFKGILIKNVKEEIEKDNQSVAIFIASLSIAVGLLNAAAISY